MVVREEGPWGKDEGAILSTEPVVSILEVAVAMVFEEIVAESPGLVVAVVAEPDGRVNSVVLSRVCASTDIVVTGSSPITTEVDVSVGPLEGVSVEITVETEAGETFSVVPISPDVM